MSEGKEVPRAAPFVGVATAAQWQKADPNVRFVDVSHYLDKDATVDFAKESIAPSVHMDIMQVCDKSQSAPCMLPTAEQFHGYCQDTLGLRSIHDRVVLYTLDNAHSLARGWFTFQLYGFSNVVMMDGGLSQWKKAGGEVVPGGSKAFSSRPGSLAPLVRNNKMVKSVDEVKSVLGADGKNQCQIVDARAADRFLAKVAEPRPGCVGGHIPGSLNIPWKAVTNSTGTGAKSLDELTGIFKTTGVDVEAKQEIICTCGSGVTACHLAVGLLMLGRPLEMSPVYDGSWSEWGTIAELPKVLADRK